MGLIKIKRAKTPKGNHKSNSYEIVVDNCSDSEPDAPGSQLTPVDTGIVTALLNPTEINGIRSTNRDMAIEYNGYIQIPQSGVYSFYAPEHLYTATMDAGYDLRVFIDDKEWMPNPSLFTENIWSIPLESGFRKIRVFYLDYRWTDIFRQEFLMTWKEDEVYDGIPVLDIYGPNLEKQPLNNNCYIIQIHNNTMLTTKNSIYYK